MTITVNPDVTPPDLGGSLRAVRASDEVALSWASVPEAYSYSLFRAIVKTTWPAAPLVEDLPTLTTSRLDVPVPPNELLYFYRIAGASCSGLEGP